MIKKAQKNGRPEKVEVFATQEQLESATFPDLLTAKGLVEPLRELSRLSYGPVIDWAFDAYNHFNGMFWNGRLPVVPITVAITPHGGCVGLTSFRHGVPRIALHPSLENSKAWGLGGRAGWQGAAMTLLHEMIHVAEATLYSGLPNPGETSHNADLWARECNRIGEAIGLPPVCTRIKPARVDGKIVRRPVNPVPFHVTMDHISRWPEGIVEAKAESIGEDVEQTVASWQRTACEMIGVTGPGSTLHSAAVT